MTSRWHPSCPPQSVRELKTIRLDSLSLRPQISLLARPPKGIFSARCHRKENRRRDTLLLLPCQGRMSSTATWQLAQRRPRMHNCVAHQLHTTHCPHTVIHGQQALMRHPTMGGGADEVVCEHVGGDTDTGRGLVLILGESSGGSSGGSSGKASCMGGQMSGRRLTLCVACSSPPPPATRSAPSHAAGRAQGSTVIWLTNSL